SPSCKMGASISRDNCQCVATPQLEPMPAATDPLALDSRLVKPQRWEPKLFGWTLLTQFSNPWEFPLPSPLRYLMFLMSSRYRNRPPVPDPRELDIRLPVTRPDFSLSLGDNKSVSVTWLGHASCLFTFSNEVRVLFDPLLGSRASPVSWIGPQRQRPAPCSPEQLPNLLAVCISHNHFDHMDRATLNQLRELQPWLHFYVPVGDAWWMTKYCGVPANQVHELSWWESVVLPESNLEIIFTPSSHWSGRNLFDKNCSLWGSYVLRHGNSAVFFGGDTGYQADVFKQIGRLYGPMKLAAIPIGAYQPRDVFEAQHVSPIEAVKIHQDVKSEKSVGIHWGTFCLSTTEALLQPPDDLKSALDEAGLPRDCFVTVRPGGSLTV
ncbi:hypothetical protein BOX15_Mlig028902g3, partial [Macrostomum lignano]